MARTVCPRILKLRLLRTRAGRRFVPGSLLKGKGTTTTSHCLQVTERLLVLLGSPLIERAGERVMKSGIEGLEALELNYVAFYFVGYQVAGFRAESFAHFSRQRYLSFT